MLTIFSLIKSVGSATVQAFTTLHNTLSYFLVPSGEPQSHGASENQKQSSIFNTIMGVFKKLGSSFSEFFVKMAGAEHFEKTVQKRELLKTDYRFCEANNNNAMPIAMLNLVNLHARVVCLFRAGFMPIDSPDLLQVVPNEPMRNKKLTHSEKLKAQFLISNVQNELAQTSATIANLLIKVALNSNVISHTQVIPKSLKTINYPYDVCNNKEYNKQAELILIKLTLILAKMHALRGVDVSRMGSRADILNEFITSFRNLLKVDENLHYLMTYQSYLSNLQIQPEKLSLQSGDSLYKWSLYVLVTYHKEVLLGNNGADGADGADNSAKVNLMDIKPIRIKKIMDITKRNIGQHDTPFGFGKHKVEGIRGFTQMQLNIPKNPVVLFKAPPSTDFASDTTMPKTIYLSNKTIFVEHGKFYNNRVIYPFLSAFAKGAVDLGITVGPANSLVKHLACGPRPPIQYQLLAKSARMAMDRPLPPQLSLLYNKLYPRMDYQRTIDFDKWALTNGNMWYLFKDSFFLNNINEELIYGKGLIGDLWDLNTFYGLAFHISRYRVKIYIDEPSAQQAWINISYAEHMLKTKNVDFRYKCSKAILFQNKELINTLSLQNQANQGYRLNPLTGQIDTSRLLSEIAFGILGLEYHFFVLSFQSKPQLARKNIDLEFLRFLQKYALFYLDTKFQEEFCIQNKDPKARFNQLRDHVIGDKLVSKAQFSKQSIREEAGRLRKAQDIGDSIVLNPTEQKVVYKLEEFFSSTPPKTAIKLSDLEDYFFNQNGYKFSSSTSLKRKLENILLQRSCKDIIKVLEEDKEGYTHAITRLKALDPLERPEALKTVFSVDHAVNRDVRDHLKDTLTKAIHEMTGNTSGMADNSGTSGNVGTSNSTLSAQQNQSDSQAPALQDSESFDQLNTTCAIYPKMYWYTLDMLLGLLPKEQQNPVFVSMLGQVHKIMSCPGQEKYPLNGALYFRHKESSETLEDFKKFLTLQAENLDYSVTLDFEETTLPQSGEVEESIII